MKDRKKTAILLTLLSAAALALTFHPQGVVMNFMGENGEKFPFYYPHWSLMPMGYGNWGPLITAASAAAAAVCSAVQLFVKKANLLKWIRSCGIAAILGGGLNCLLGGMTIYGTVILALMAVVAGLVHHSLRT